MKPVGVLTAASVASAGAAVIQGLVVGYPELVRLAGTDVRAWWRRVRALALGTGVPLGVTGLLAIPLAAWLIPWFAGAMYRPAVPTAQLLLTGSVVWLACFWLRPAYLSLGLIRPWTVIAVVIAVADGLAMLWVAPEWGHVGMAWLWLLWGGIAGHAIPVVYLVRRLSAASRHPARHPEGAVRAGVEPADPPSRPPGAVFLSSGRHAYPLDAATTRKFMLLTTRRDVWVIGFAPGLVPGGFAQHARFLLLPWLPARLLRHCALAGVGTLLAVWCVVRYRAAILVAASPQEALVAVAAKTLARCLGRRAVVVVESHGDFESAPLLYRRVWWPSLSRRVTRAIARVSLGHADLLRAVSDSTRHQLTGWAPGRTIIQFPAWTDLEPFFAAPPSAELGSDVAYAGVLAPIKGVHVLLDALAQVNRRRTTTLSIMGAPVNRDYAAALRCQAERLALGGVVRFVGPLPVSAVATRLASTRLLALPSLSEGLPRVLLEAMAAGRPVIASRTGGIPEIVQDGVTGLLVPPGDDRALADGILRLLEHPQEAAAMGARGRTFARKFFSAARYAEGYARLFEAADRLLEARRT